MKLSKYVRLIPFNEDEVIMYDSIGHSVVTLPKDYVIENSCLSDDCDEESVSVLSEMGYFLSDIDPVILKSRIINDEKLFISLELNLSCNMRCPYCYQSGADKSRVVSYETLDLLANYFEFVYSHNSFKELHIKILGGEPTLEWTRFEYIYNKSKEFCRNRGIKFCVLIDTNGTNVDKILKLDNYDNLLLTIPLTEKSCHNSVRFDEQGNGTYDRIIQNINKLAVMKNIKIVLRYNVDTDNIGYFDQYLDDLKSKISFTPVICVNYTINFECGTEYENKLTYDEFVKWSSTIAIDLLIKAGFNVTISPLISIEECQFRSNYSLKLFADGTIGSCATNFFDNQREFLKDIIAEPVNNFWSAKKRQTLLADEECLTCSSLFLCGGTIKLPCLQPLTTMRCDINGNHTVLLDEFLKRYVRYENEGKGEMFSVFKDGIAFR